MPSRTEPSDVNGGRADTLKRRIKVLEVVHSLDVGGAEVWLMSLLQFFHGQGSSPVESVAMDFLATSGRPGVFDEKARSLGARVFYARYSIRSALRFGQTLGEVLSTGHYDAIHDHQGFPAGIHFLLGKRFLPPVRIAHFHNPASHRLNSQAAWLNPLRLGIGRAGLLREATQIMGTSTACLSDNGLRDCAYAHLRPAPIYCGIDVSAFSDSARAGDADVRAEFAWPPSARILLFVGRLGSDEAGVDQERDIGKNPQFALEVIAELSRTDSSVFLLMAGAGETKRKQLVTFAEAHGLRERVRLLGPRSDVPRLMKASDLLLFPSREEGLGLVAVEAQAAGVPVLASDSVPRECAVIPSMVTFLPLTRGAPQWAEVARQILGAGRPSAAACTAMVAKSPFSIEASARALVSAYAPAIGEPQRRPSVQKTISGGLGRR